MKEKIIVTENELITTLIKYNIISKNKTGVYEVLVDLESSKQDPGLIKEFLSRCCPENCSKEDLLKTLYRSLTVLQAYKTVVSGLVIDFDFVKTVYPLREIYIGTGEKAYYQLFRNKFDNLNKDDIIEKISNLVAQNWNIFESLNSVCDIL